MKRNMLGILTLMTLVFGVTAASATTVWLNDWAINVDGVMYPQSTSGNGFNSAGFDWDTGLGTLQWTTNVAGNHKFIAFFDHEIDAEINTLYNETGAFAGSAGAGQSWEIDEPGYIHGDIYTNVITGLLDNMNQSGQPDDISMAMGWDFFLQAGQRGTIALCLSEEAPAGFYLEHADPDSGATIYFSGNLAISDGSADPVPEPATIVLMLTGLAGLAGFRKRKFII